MNSQLKKLFSILSFFIYITNNAGDNIGETNRLVKKDVSSLVQILPIEITQKITKYLPETEQEKMFLVSKQIFNQTYLLKKENRIRAFKNYLHYPYLSRFYKEISRLSGNFSSYDDLSRPEPITITPLFYGDTESNTLNELLQNDHNKKDFYQILLKEANPKYFDVQNWRKFFDLRRSKKFNIRDEAKNVLGNCRVISLNQNNQTLLSSNDINKVLIIQCKYNIFDANAIQKSIFELYLKNIDITTKNKIQPGDRVRIIFTLDPTIQNNFTSDINIISNYYQNIILLGTNLFNLFQQNGVAVKVLDRSINYYNNMENMLDLTNFLGFEQVSKECEIYISLYDAQIKSLFQEDFRKNNPNITPKPYLLERHVFELRPDFFKYLCDKNFGLKLSLDLSTYNTQDFIYYTNILKDYILPYALLSDGYTFLDKIFETIIKKFLDNSMKTVESVNFFIPFVQQYGIDLNTYIYHRHSTFLVEIFKKLDITSDFIQPDQTIFYVIIIFISEFMKKGIDPFFEVDRKTILEHFFEKQLFGRIQDRTDIVTRSNLEFDIFKDFIKYQNKTENGDDLFGYVTNEGNTILHSYFKYTNKINIMIINEIINAKKLNINAKNNSNETAFEVFLVFVDKIRIFSTQQAIGRNQIVMMGKARPLDGQTVTLLNDIVDKFIEKGFDFNVKTHNGIPLRNLAPQYPELDWQKIELRIPSEKKSRW